MPDDHAINAPAAEQAMFSDRLEQHLAPYRRHVLECQMIKECQQGTLPVHCIRSWIAQQYAYVYAFPAWFGMVLRKVDDPVCRAAMMANIGEERGHPPLWLALAGGWGLSAETVAATELCPEMQALNDYLWCLSFDGHVVQAGAALCVALEGMSKAVIDTITPALARHYNGRDGVRLDAKALGWLTTHATVDVEHEADGANLLDHYATTPELQQKAMFAGRRALEFLRLGFDGVYCRVARPEAGATVA